MLGIKDIQSYIPSNKLTNDELVERLGVENEFLTEKVGIVSRCIAEDHEAASDLGIKAADKIFQNHAALKREDVDLLIVVTQNPDYKLPHTGAIIQDALGLRSVASFDINLGCSGFVYALAVAKSMMHTLGFKNAFVITADIYSRIVHPSDKSTVTLFGDAGAAVWVGRDASNELLHFTLGTDGSGADSLIVKGGGSRFPPGSLQIRPPAEGGNGHDPCNLYMDGREIYNFMMKEVPGDIKRCLQINECSLDQIDYFVFHQASKFMLESLTARLGIPKEKVIVFLEEIGNTVSSSIPIALEHLFKTRDIADKKILISGFGVGLSWGSGIIQCQ